MGKTGGGIYKDIGNGIAVNSAGDIFITGEFAGYGGSPPPRGTATFENVTLTSLAVLGIFVVKYDASGNVKWAKSGDGYESLRGYDITVDSLDRPLITGYFSGMDVHFDTVKITSPSIGYVTGNTFLAKYDTSGNAMWAKAVGGVTNTQNGMAVDGGRAIAVDHAGNSYIASGFFEGGIIANNIVLYGQGGNDLFLAKYSPTGALLWR